MILLRFKVTRRSKFIVYFSLFHLWNISTFLHTLRRNSNPGIFRKFVKKKNLSLNSSQSTFKKIYKIIRRAFLLLWYSTAAQFYRILSVLSWEIVQSYITRGYHSASREFQRRGTIEKHPFNLTIRYSLISTCLERLLQTIPRIKTAESDRTEEAESIFCTLGACDICIIRWTALGRKNARANYSST